MRKLTLRSGLALAVVAALVPIAALSVIQARAVLDYHGQLIGNRLLISALAMAGRERSPLTIAERVVMTVSHNADVRRAGPGCADGLKSALIGNPALVNIFRLDAEGRVLCSVLPAGPTMSFAGKVWWQRGMAVRQFTLSAPETSPISGQRVIFGMQPLYSPTGAFDGAVVASIQVAWLQQLLAKEKLSQHAVVAVVSQAGRVLMIDGPATLPRFDIANATDKVIATEASDGRTWLYAAAPLYEGEMYIVYAEPRDELMAIAIRQVRISLILPIIAIILTLTGIWLSTNWLVIRWLVRLSKIAAQFAGGQYRNDPGDFRQAPQEIKLLSTDLHVMGEAIATRDSELRAALDAKTALTNEVHHRVKNNLQIVSSLLTLQSRRVTDPVAREALAQTRARIGALTQIHRLLHEDAFDKDVVDGAFLLTDLCTQLRSLHAHQQNIELLCKTQSCVMPVSNAVPLSLFAVEAVTNSFRHAFPVNRTGVITLNLSSIGNNGVLRINDNGIGFSGKSDSGSVGTLLMAAFAQQLNGSYDIVSGPDGGTEIVLHFPLNGQASN